MRKVVDAIIFDWDWWLLLTRKKDTWILPWWKIDDWETEIETLSREISEELNGAIIKEDTIVPYKVFDWLTPFSWKPISVMTYFSQLTEWIISHSAEILEAKYIKDFESVKLSTITREIIDTLITDWYIKK